MRYFGKSQRKSILTYPIASFANLISDDQGKMHRRSGLQLPLSIMYMTPFQRPSQRPAERLGYALEVRVGRRVVLSLAWNSADPIFLETYRPGAWETKLEEPAVTASLAA
jgi:hypothetical protein